MQDGRRPSCIYLQTLWTYFGWLQEAERPLKSMHIFTLQPPKSMRWKPIQTPGCTDFFNNFFYVFPWFLLFLVQKFIFTTETGLNNLYPHKKSPRTRKIGSQEAAESATWRKTIKTAKITHFSWFWLIFTWINRRMDNRQTDWPTDEWTDWPMDQRTDTRSARFKTHKYA